MDVLPPDPTNLEDMIHANLMSDKPEQALEYAARLDLWLAAHMADVMERLGMVDAVPDELCVPAVASICSAFAHSIGWYQAAK